MKLLPLSDFVILERRKAPDKTKGGIVVPDRAKDNPTTAISEGLVLDAGPGVRDLNNVLQPMNVKKGDVVLYHSCRALDVEIDGTSVVIVRQYDLVATVEREAN